MKKPRNLRTVRLRRRLLCRGVGLTSIDEIYLIAPADPNLSQLIYSKHFITMDSFCGYHALLHFASCGSIVQDCHALGMQSGFNEVFVIHKAIFKI